MQLPVRSSSVTQSANGFLTTTSSGSLCGGARSPLTTGGVLVDCSTDDSAYYCATENGRVPGSSLVENQSSTTTASSSTYLEQQIHLNYRRTAGGCSSAKFDENQTMIGNATVCRTSSPVFVTPMPPSQQHLYWSATSSPGGSTIPAPPPPPVVHSQQQLQHGNQSNMTAAAVTRASRGNGSAAGGNSLSSSSSRMTYGSLTKPRHVDGGKELVDVII